MNTSVTARKDKGRIQDENAARYKLNDIFCAAWLSHTLTALIDNGVFDEIENEPLRVEEIATKAGLHAPSLYRALRGAAANGILTEVETGLFEHNEASRLLRSDHPHSWKGMAKMWNHPSCLSAWGRLGRVLKDGRSGIEHAFGKTLYEHLAEVEGGTEAFSDAMISNSTHTSIAIAKAFPFQKYQTVLDLGGGIGTLLAAILEEHKHLDGINFEIPELQLAAEEYLGQRNLRGRIKTVVGNFLQDIPAGVDLYMVKNSLWNWDDENCKAIMNNVREAIGTKHDSRFLIIEYIIDEQNAQWATLYDLQILNMPGGRARTVEEYTELLARSGFVIESVEFVQDQTLLLAKPI